MFEEFKNHGITESTPQEIMLGVGTIHKNLQYGYYLLTAQPADWTTNYSRYYSKTTENNVDTYTPLSSAPTFATGTYYVKRWNAQETIIGATSGGGKFSIVPDIKRVEVDGANVATKGLDIKIGEKATLEASFVEYTPDRIKELAIGRNGTAVINGLTVDGYSVIESKPNIEDSDYADNVAFVGKRLDGSPIIIVMDNALCTSGFESDRKPKDNAVTKAVYECYQEIDKDLTTLPWRVYYPTPAA